MIEWDLHITYGITPFVLKAQVEYQSSQIMRIRVHGNKRTLLLENNFPIMKLNNKKQAIKWKIREGFLDQSNVDSARFLSRMIELLEYEIKDSFLY